MIEHILHPEIILEKMANCLKVNGRLIITQLDSIGPVEDAPMHLEVNLHQCEKLLNSLGVFRSETHTWLWEKQVVP